MPHSVLIHSLHRVFLTPSTPAWLLRKVCIGSYRARFRVSPNIRGSWKRSALHMRGICRHGTDQKRDGAKKSSGRADKNSGPFASVNRHNEKPPPFLFRAFLK